MSELTGNKETEPKHLTFEGGTLGPLQGGKDRGAYRQKYTVKIPLPGIDHFRESTYYLKSESEDAKRGAVERVTYFEVEGSIYPPRPSTEVIPEGTIYQLEERDNPDNTKTTVLTLTTPLDEKQENTA